MGEVGLFEIAAAFVAFLGGWLMKILWGAVRDLQTADKEMASKISSIEVLVAGDYVKRTEFENMTRRLFEKLDKIDGKLDGKADK